MITYTHIQADTAEELEEYLASRQVADEGFNEAANDEEISDASLETEEQEVWDELVALADEEPVVKSTSKSSNSWYIALGDQGDYFMTNTDSPVDDIVSSQQAFLGYLHSLLVAYANQEDLEKGITVIQRLDAFQ